jgi:hypothetical protein
MCKQLHYQMKVLITVALAEDLVFAMLFKGSGKQKTCGTRKLRKITVVEYSFLRLRALRERFTMTRNFQSPISFK